MCFIHVLLNALDMDAKGDEAKIIIEGASVKLIPELVKSDNPLNGLWKKNLEAGLVEGVCKACSSKLGTLEAAKEHGLTLLDDMFAHPNMSATVIKDSKSLPSDSGRCSVQYHPKPSGP